MSSQEWWEHLSVNEEVGDYVPESYTPSTSVEINHNLLAGLREDEFDNRDSTYITGLVMLALVFLASGLFSSILLACLSHYLPIKSTEEQRLEHRPKFGRRLHTEGNLLLIVVSMMAMLCAFSAILGLHKADYTMAEIEMGTEGIAADFTTVLSLPNDTAEALGGVSTSYDALLDDFGDCTSDIVVDTILGSTPAVVDSLVEDVQEEVENLDREILGKLVNDVQGVVDFVKSTEGIRKGLVWPLISLSMVVILVFIAIALGTYECAVWNISDCDCISRFISPCAVILAAMLWLLVVTSASFSATSGDFCVDPDSSTQTLLVENPDQEEALAELVVYYTGDCTSDNILIDVIVAAQEAAKPFIEVVLPTVYETANVCQRMTSFAEEVDQTLLDLWTILAEAGELTSCENINSQYQTVVYDSFCDKLSMGLFVSWVSCTSLAFLLLMLAALWSRMLRRKRAVEEERVLEARECCTFRGRWKLVSRSCQTAEESDLTDSRRMESSVLNQSWRGEN